MMIHPCFSDFFLILLVYIHREKMCKNTTHAENEILNPYQNRRESRSSEMGVSREAVRNFAFKLSLGD